MNTNNNFLYRRGRKFFTRTRRTRPIDAARLETIGERNYFHPEAQPDEQWFSNLEPECDIAKVLAKYGHTKYRVGEQAYNKQGHKIGDLRRVPVFVPIENARVTRTVETEKILDSIHEQVRDRYPETTDLEAAKLMIEETVHRLEEK